MMLLFRRCRLAGAVLAALAALSVHAQTDVPAIPSAPEPVPAAQPPEAPEAPKPLDGPGADAGKEGAKPQARPSAMTASLFYEVLLGELSARGGDPGQGFGLMLDAARRTRDPLLFKRAVEIAMQGRSGNAALDAARAWRASLPDSQEARRLELQILLALNRIDETAPLLRAELAATPKAEHPIQLIGVVRSYMRANDKKLAARVVEEALADDLADPATAGPAWAAVGRLRLVAGDNTGAMDAIFKGQQADARAEAPVMLAMDMMGPEQPLAEPVVQRYLEASEARPEIRLSYARTLTEARRYPEAMAQLQKLTARNPQMADPWLLLGGLQAQMRQDKAAESSVKRYVDLRTRSAKAEKGSAGKGSDDNRGLTQAYFLLSQIAERRKDYAGAGAWLARIQGDADDRAAMQVRRATLLMRQGQLAQARELVQALPDADADDKRRKLLAEVQLLRDAGENQEAYDMLDKANANATEDGDLIYDQAMVAEKLGRLDDMERLLRRLIEIKPGNQNAYNALGYSLADRNLRLDEARELIRKAVQLAPEDPFIADSLGWVEFRLGNTSEALRILEDAYKRQPDTEIAAHLGEVLWISGNRNRALAIWKEAVRADADNETLQETLKRLRVKP